MFGYTKKVPYFALLCASVLVMGSGFGQSPEPSKEKDSLYFHLLDAIGNRDFDETKKLIDILQSYGADLNDRWMTVHKMSFDSPLWEAYQRKDAEMIRFLLDAGLSLKNMEGQLMLSEAAENGETELVALILAEGVDPNDRNPLLNPLLLAAGKGHKEVARLLVDAGADHYVGRLSHLSWFASLGMEAAVELLLDLGLDPNFSFKNTLPLTEALKLGNEKVVRLLLSRGAIPLSDQDMRDAGVSEKAQKMLRDNEYLYYLYLYDIQKELENLGIPVDIADLILKNSSYRIDQLDEVACQIKRYGREQYERLKELDRKGPVEEVGGID